jgi:hypothetical protein
MKKREEEPYGYNSPAKLSPFFTGDTGNSEPFLTRVKDFVGWVCGAALTAPSSAPDYMSEHYRRDTPVAPLSQAVQVEQVQV